MVEARADKSSELKISMEGIAMKIGWVGIGRMGLPMVNRLLDAKYQLTVWNRTREKAAPLAQRG
jgi:3-hydroxyisobutyrate dehydrogenase